MRKKLKLLTESELKAAGAFALTFGVGVVGMTQDRDDAAARCFDRPAAHCFVRSPRPVEPAGGGQPIQTRAPLSITTSTSNAYFTAYGDFGAGFDATVRRAR